MIFIRVVICLALLVCSATVSASDRCFMLVSSSSGLPGLNPDLPSFLATVSLKPSKDYIPILQKKIMQVSKHERDGVRSALGYAYCSTGQYEKAIETSQKLADKTAGFNPHRDSAVLNMAVSHFELGNHDMARTLVNRVPGFSGFAKGSATAPAGELALKLGDVALAKALLEESIDYHEYTKRIPRSWIVNSLAEVYRVQNDADSLYALNEKYGGALKETGKTNPLTDAESQFSH